MRSSTRWFRASDDTHLVRLVGQRAWLQERNVVFGVDLDGPTLGPSFALVAGEELREIEGNVAVIQTSDKGLRGVDIESGDEQWRIEPDDRFYLDRRRSFSIRWWYESKENETHVRRLDLASGEFGDAQVLEHESFSAPVLYSWADEDLLATGRGRDVHIVYADGRAPERRRLSMAPGGDARFIFPFAGTWYVQGTGEGAEGPFTRLVPLDAERPTLQCEALAYPSIASGDRLVIVSSDGHAFAYVWEPGDEQPTKRYLGEGRFLRAVAAGPHAVTLVGSTLHIQGSTGQWSTFEAPTDSLVRIEDREGAPTLVMSGGGLALCPIAEMAELGPGSHPHPVQTVPVPMPAPPAAEVRRCSSACMRSTIADPSSARHSSGSSSSWIPRPPSMKTSWSSLPKMEKSDTWSASRATSKAIRSVSLPETRASTRSTTASSGRATSRSRSGSRSSSARWWMTVPPSSSNGSASSSTSQDRIRPERYLSCSGRPRGSTPR